MTEQDSPNAGLANIVVVKMNKIVWLVLAIAVVGLTLFDVSINFRFALPAEEIVPDSEIEALFEACFQARDDDIHRTAFSTIDNPDVQKEFIASNRSVARAECRAQIPAQTTTVMTRLQFNVIDLEPRFW